MWLGGAEEFASGRSTPTARLALSSVDKCHNPFQMEGTLGCALTSIVANSHFGKLLGAEDMTILVFHVGPQICNI